MVSLSAGRFRFEVEIKQVLGEVAAPAAPAYQALLGILLHVGLQRGLLVELFAAILALEMFIARVYLRVTLEAGRMGEGFRALLTDVGAE